MSKKLVQDPRVDLHLKELENGKNISTSITEFRRNLPIFEKREKFLKLIQNSKVTLIKGETGCGKSTQVPQYILEENIKNGFGSITNILVTQPRRISAVGVAGRVATERGEQIGKIESSVGYEIRFDSQKPRDQGSITYCTTGIVFQKLRNNANLQNVSHIILDEVHERDLFMDVLLAVLKAMKDGKAEHLKVIVMSASLPGLTFREYFPDCGYLKLKGRTFPVTEYFLEDFLGNFNLPGLTYHPLDFKISAVESNSENYKPLVFTLIVQIIQKIEENHENGAILVFLSGWEDITKLKDELSEAEFAEKFEIHCLHSQVEISKQIDVFKHATEGKRKVILSTNIAETSVTIDDVVFVIDTGYIKSQKFNYANNSTTFAERWTSQSNVQQRTGRAGRTQPGFCWHLFTRERYENFHSFLLPAIKCQPLEDVILNIISLKLEESVHFYLDYLLDPPQKIGVMFAMDTLRNIGAMNSENEDLTVLGEKMAQIPLHPVFGKMLIWGAMFRCLEPILNIVSLMSEKDPFVITKRSERYLVNVVRKEFSKNEASDHLMLSNIMFAWENALNNGEQTEFCYLNWLNIRVLYEASRVKDQLYKRLESIDLIKISRDFMNTNSENTNLIKGVLAAGLFPKVKTVGYNLEKGFSYLKDDNDNRNYIHIKSVNFGAKLPEKCLIFYKVRNGKNDTILVEDSTNLRQTVVELFTPWGDEIEEIKVLRYRMERYIEDYLAGNPGWEVRMMVPEQIADYISQRTRNSRKFVTKLPSYRYFKN